MRFKVGDWVTDGDRIAKVKDTDESGNTLDLVLYDRMGNRIGRESPAFGGPRGFEPCCHAEHWRRIHEPVFPVPKYCFLVEHLTLCEGEEWPA